MNFSFYPLDLVQNFEIQTMMIWYALLLEKRVIFTGSPAENVMKFCLSAPKIVAPLTGFSKYLIPYVSMTNLDPLDANTFICGITNKKIEEKTDLYDVCASLFQKKVLNSTQIKIQSSDLIFIENILEGIKKGNGNEWVMEKFQEYTEKFFTSILFNNFFSNVHNLISVSQISTY